MPDSLVVAGEEKRLLLLDRRALCFQEAMAPVAVSGPWRRFGARCALGLALGAVGLGASIVLGWGGGVVAIGGSATFAAEDSLGFTSHADGYWPISESTANLYGTWSHVVEPHRVNTFSATGVSSDAAELTWRVARLRDFGGTEEEEVPFEVSSSADGSFRARTWGAFEHAREWAEEYASVSYTTGASMSLSCTLANARYRVALTETSGTASDFEATAAGDATWWDPENQYVLSPAGLFTDASWSDSRRRRVASSDSVVCKYVRREVRSLTLEDREAYLSAVALVHRVDASEGSRVYGARFKDQRGFLLKHLGEDTVKGCTIFHGSDSFLTGHAAFQLELEQALQAVDARIAAPYWDTSVDDAAYGADWEQNTRIFDDDWLGAREGSKRAVEATGYPALDTGRFAYVSIPSVDLDTDDLPPERNAYGRLTQTYNNDPALFVWRARSVCGLPTKLRLPGCDALRGVLSQNSLSDFRAKVETDWHGSLHPTLGGAFECGNDNITGLTSVLRDSPELLQFLHQLVEVVWDVAHAQGQLVCPASCAQEVSFKDCACHCPARDLLQDVATNATAAYEFLDELQILSRYAGSQRGDVFVRTTRDGAFCLAPAPDADCLDAERSDAVWLALASLACAPGRVSPFMTPLAATNDPLFWVTHASFERFWAFKRLAAAASRDDAANDDPASSAYNNPFTGGGSSSPGVSAARETVDALRLGIIVDDSADDSADLNFDEAWDWRSADDSHGAVGTYCAGKAWRDPTPFAGFLNDSQTLFYTNAELYALFDPMNAKLPYIFDDLQWGHCRA